MERNEPSWGREFIAKNKSPCVIYLVAGWQALKNRKSKTHTTQLYSSNEISEQINRMITVESPLLAYDH